MQPRFPRGDLGRVELGDPQKGVASQELQQSPSRLVALIPGVVPRLPGSQCQPKLPGAGQLQLQLLQSWATCSCKLKAPLIPASRPLCLSLGTSWGAEQAGCAHVPPSPRFRRPR